MLVQPTAFALVGQQVASLSQHQQASANQASSPLILNTSSTPSAPSYQVQHPASGQQQARLASLAPLRQAQQQQQPQSAPIKVERPSPVGQQPATAAQQVGVTAVARKRGRRRQQSVTEQPNGLDRVFIWDIDGSLVRSDTIADSAEALEPSVLASVSDKLGSLAKRLKEVILNFCDEHLFLGELESSDQMHIDDVPGEQSDAQSGKAAKQPVALKPCSSSSSSSASSSSSSNSAPSSSNHHSTSYLFDGAPQVEEHAQSSGPAYYQHQFQAPGQVAAEAAAVPSQPISNGYPVEQPYGAAGVYEEPRSAHFQAIGEHYVTDYASYQPPPVGLEPEPEQHQQAGYYAAPSSSNNHQATPYLFDGAQHAEEHPQASQASYYQHQFQVPSQVPSEATVVPAQPINGYSADQPYGASVYDEPSGTQFQSLADHYVTEPAPWPTSYQQQAVGLEPEPEQHQQAGYYATPSSSNGNHAAPYLFEGTQHVEEHAQSAQASYYQHQFQVPSQVSTGGWHPAGQIAHQSQPVGFQLHSMHQSHPQGHHHHHHHHHHHLSHSQHQHQHQHQHQQQQQQQTQQQHQHQIQLQLQQQHQHQHQHPHQAQNSHSQARLDGFPASNKAAAICSNGTANTPTTTTTTLRSVINNHHKIQRISMRFQRIKAVYNLNRGRLNMTNEQATGAILPFQSETSGASQQRCLEGTKLEAAAGQGLKGELCNGNQQVLMCTDLLNEILAEIDHYTLDWRRHALDCLKLISESPNCTNIIITRLPLVVALAHLACLGLGEFFEVDQVYSACKTSKEACIKRIKKRFGASNRCSYIIVGGRDDVEMAKRLDLPSWTTSRSDGHRQLLQLHTALKEGYLM